MLTRDFNRGMEHSINKGALVVLNGSTCMFAGTYRDAERTAHEKGFSEGNYWQNI